MQMARNCFKFLALCTASALAFTEGRKTDIAVAAHPIRKVVTMLQAMTRQVEAEGDKQAGLYDKFMCYCKSGVDELKKSLAQAEVNVPQLTSTIAESEASLAGLKAGVEKDKADLAETKAGISSAAELRNKAAAAAAKEKSDYATYIAALNKAIGAIEKGIAGGFLQTRSAKVLAQVAQMSKILMEDDKNELLAFLEVPAYGNEYAPQNQEIVGILKQLLDEFLASQKSGTDGEAKSIKDFKSLLQAKLKEIAALHAAIEGKLARIGELSARLAALRNDLGDAEVAREYNGGFLADLEKTCASKTAEWEDICKSRAAELLALADTIRILSDNDALDLFKKSSPGASLLQLQVTVEALRQRALAKIRGMRPSTRGSRRPKLDLIALALSGKKVGFGKVVAMIDEMTTTLKQEQTDDDGRLAYCTAALDEADDKKKALGRSISDSEAEIARLQDAITTAGSEVDELKDGIEALDKAVAEATGQRKEEHDDCTSILSQNSAAKELLRFAANRLQKFYDPKLYTPPPKRELTEEERITVNNGGTLAPTEPPAGIAGTGITAFVQLSASRQPLLRKVDIGAPPPSVGSYSKKSEESSGVMAMMGLLIKDLDKEMTEATAEEKNSQLDYERFMRDSSEKRVEDSRAMLHKEDDLAKMRVDLVAKKDAQAGAENELKATVDNIHALHTECDWLMKYYAVRKEARASETDALANAKAVLNGADLSLLQTDTSGSPRAKHFLRGQ